MPSGGSDNLVWLLPHLCSPNPKHPRRVYYDERLHESYQAVRKYAVINWLGHLHEPGPHTWSQPRLGCPRVRSVASSAGCVNDFAVQDLLTPSSMTTSDTLAQWSKRPRNCLRIRRHFLRPSSVCIRYSGALIF